jgi:hypothetical protein
MNPFGKNLNIKRRNDEPTEKEIFLDIILIMDECWARTNHMEEVMKLGTADYEEPFYIVIENLIFLHYGEWKGNIILWWLFERFTEEGDLLPVEINDQDKGTTEEVFVETPEQLWELIKKIELK